MRCAKCLKILRHVTVRSQIWERTDKNAIILLIILFTFLSPSNTYLSLSATQLSLLSGLHLSVAPYFFLTFIFFLSLSLCILVLSLQIRPVSMPLSLSLSLSLSLFYFILFFFCHYLSLFLFLSRRRRWFRSEAELVNWSLPIWTSTHQSEALLTQGSRRSLLVVLHSSHHRWLVEFGHWLICWVGVLLKILSFFIIIYFVEIFGFGIFWRIQWLWL